MILTNILIRRVSSRKFYPVDRDIWSINAMFDLLTTTAWMRSVTDKVAFYLRFMSAPKRSLSSMSM